MAKRSYNVQYGNLEPGAVQVLEKKYFLRRLQAEELNSDSNHRDYQPAPPKELKSNLQVAMSKIHARHFTSLIMKCMKKQQPHSPLSNL